MADEERGTSRLTEEAKKAFEDIGTSYRPEAERSQYPKMTPEQEAERRRQLAVGPDKGGGEMARGRQARQRGAQAEMGGDGEVKGRMAMSATGQNVQIKGVTLSTRAENADVRGFSGAVVNRGDTRMKGFTMALVNGGRTQLTGGAPVIVSGEQVDIARGGAGLVVSRKARIGENGWVGAVLGGKVRIERGAKVLIAGLPALLIGAAVGAGIALFASMLAGGRLGVRMPDLGKTGEKAYRRARKQGRRAIRQARKQGMQALREVRRSVNA